MALIEELKQYEDMIFPNLDAMQKAIRDILENFRYLRELHKVSDGSDNIRRLDELNCKFNTLVDMRAKESSKMAMDLEDFIEYFRMLTTDNVTVETLLQILLGLKDVVKIRINSSEELKNEFEKFRISMLRYISSQSSGFGDDYDGSDVEVADHAEEKQVSKIIDEIQLPNFRSVSYRIFIKIMGIPIFIYFSLRWVEPVKMWQVSIAPFWLAFFVFSGCCLVNHKVIYRYYRNIKYLITTFNRKNDTTMDNERKQSKYKRNISTKLPVILTHLEILIQFWKQQFDIFESHINVLRSVGGNMNLKLSNRSLDGIIARCEKEKINCVERDIDIALSIAKILEEKNYCDN
ncbi:33990_t:CDS:2 [Gigaspora margarita]|uniref:33990_t:CDS:1 n=1 Tax=Gigaspora margarita TaxID=4874 RepID=A0ABN7UDL3_GIGMA|nr:33990_t:CDS:2 [Gigaspora margarita]